MKTTLTTRHTTHYSPFIIMAIVVLAFYALNFFSSQYHDDFVYKFMITGGASDYSHRIGSIGDIIRSQVDHYFTVNGRSIVHFFVQLFTGLLGKQVFNVFNALVFAVFVWLLKLNLTRRSALRANGFAIAVVVTMTLLLPRFKDTFLWMTGSINYLWSSTVILAFLLYYDNKRQQPVDASLAWILPLAFLAGWTHEGISLPLALSLVFFSLLQFKQSYRQQGLWMALFLLGGACVAALSPGTFSRLGEGSEIAVSTIGVRIKSGLTLYAKLRLIYLAIIITVVAWVKDRQALKQAIVNNNYLIGAIVLAGGIVLMCGLSSTRTAFGLELFSMVFTIRLLGIMIKDSTAPVLRYCSIALTIGLIVFYTLLLRHTIPSWQESQRLIAQITHTHDGIIGTNEHQAGAFSDFICTMISPDAAPNSANYKYTQWPVSIAATYHCDSLVFLPQRFLDDLKLHSEKYELIDKNLPLEFFVQHLEDGESVSEVRYLLSPTDFSSFPFFLRPIAKKMNYYKSTSAICNKWAIVTLYGKRYLIIKRDHDYDDRLLDIQIIHKEPKH